MIPGGVNTVHTVLEHLIVLYSTLDCRHLIVGTTQMISPKKLFFSVKQDRGETSGDGEEMGE